MTRKTERPTPDAQDDHVMIGEVVKPHGIRGEIKVYPYSERPDNFRNYKKIVLRPSSASGVHTYSVVHSREQGKLAILQLEGIATREAAEDLAGSKVWLRKSDFPLLDSDEYYWHQLKGLAVWTDAGREIGRVSGLFRTTAHDVMVVAGSGREYMIPVQGDIIRTIDVEGGRIIISPPSGLLEMNK